MKDRALKIVIAPDSFKESLSAAAVAKAIARGFGRVLPDAEIVALPVADGGEGTTEALIAATQGRLVEAEVKGPLGHPVKAFWGMLGEGETAVIETAAASGLALVAEPQRDVLAATSYGTGELILKALDAGAQRILLGLGGSATNDGGAGLLTALGVRFENHRGEPLAAGGAALAELARIDLTGMDPRMNNIPLIVACDVNNPLTGQDGASAVFGPQKGASVAEVAQLDAALNTLGRILQQTSGKAVAELPGAGAAGGIGASLLALFEPEFSPGIDVVLQAVGFQKAVQNADLVVTGEGRIDSQTLAGKTPVGVAAAAEKAGVPTIALAGAVSDSAKVIENSALSAIVSITPGVVSLEQALAEAEQNLEACAANVARLWQLGFDVPN